MIRKQTLRTPVRRNINKKERFNKKDRLGYCDGVPHRGLPQYGKGTPISELTQEDKNLRTDSQLAVAGLNIAGNFVGNNDVENTVENIHGNTFEGLMANQSELNAAANKGIDGGNVAGSALSTAGQYAGTGAEIGTMIGGPGVGTAIGAGIGALAGGAVGLFKGKKEEEDRINSLRNQVDVKTAQAEQTKLNNLNNDLPVYQMASGGEIPPMTPIQNNTIPNDIMKVKDIGIGYTSLPGKFTTGEWKTTINHYSPETSFYKIVNTLDLDYTKARKEYNVNQEKFRDKYLDKLNEIKGGNIFYKSTNIGSPTLDEGVPISATYKETIHPAFGDEKTLEESKLNLGRYSNKKRDNNLYYRKNSEGRPVFLDSDFPHYDKRDVKAFGGDINTINTSNNNTIAQYNGQTHDGANGGIPIDRDGNPTVLTGNKPVALTEDGEVNFKGYIFSNRIKYK